MTRVSTAVVALTALLIFSTGAQAVPLYNFATPSGGPVFHLGPSEVFTGPSGDITASAYYWDGDSWEVSELITRNVTNDHGLGNCSEQLPITGTEVCTGDGNINELSQLTSTEAILLDKADDEAQWAGFWLSSLDADGDGPDPENGTLFWGNTIAELLSGANLFPFTYPAFGGSLVEGNLGLPTAGYGFDPFARFVLFVPGAGITDYGDNNDYLVWGVDLRGGRGGEGDLSPVPEPASLVLLGSGLVALAHKRRRDGRR